MDELLSKIVSLSKRKGFVFPSSDIYGGLSGFYDYGPLGVELKNNIKKAWWKEIVQKRRDVIGIDGAIISHPRVWEASGHIESFSDPMVDCKKCRKRFKADQLAESLGKTAYSLPDLKKALSGGKCPECQGELTEPRQFHLLMKTGLGVIEGEKADAYLRGEACQNIYLNYYNVLQSSRQKIPFGIAQIGKAFRNEITPKNFLLRQREFEQWDLEWFVNPKEAKKWFEYWKEERMNWYKSLLNNKKNIRFHEHNKDELAHYAKTAFDIEYKTSFGWKEWEGIHWRGDWDLSRHGEFSGNDFTYKNDEGESFIPWVIETSGGVDRTFLFLLLDAYHEEEIKGEKRVVLKFKPELSPVKAAILPLVKNKPVITDKAKEVYDQLKEEFNIQYDETGSIGRRYRRQDEIGTPICITIDFDSLEDDTVTLRDRDSMKQIRVKIDKLKIIIQNIIKGEDFSKQKNV